MRPVNKASYTGHLPASTERPIRRQHGGDVGVQKALAITLSATMTEGAAGVVLYRTLARLELTDTNVPNAIDALTSGFPRLYNNSVPFLVFIPNTTTTSNISGQVIYTQG